MCINTCMKPTTVQSEIITSSKSNQIIMNGATIAGKCIPGTTTTATTVTEFAGDWGDSDCNCSVTDIEPEFAGDWGDFDCNCSITDTEPEFEGDWADSDFYGNESGPE